MKDYRNEIRMKVTAARGIIDHDCLADEDTDLDVAIVQMASDSLNDALFLCFYFAFYCVESWEAVQELYLTKLNKEIKMETIRRFARDAGATLQTKAPNFKELNEWERRRDAEREG